jgi:hypothetical protein
MANISAKLSLNVPAITALCKGEPGTSMLNGTVAPTIGIGNDGDFFINTTSYQLYGPKAGGWGIPAQLNNNILAPKWDSAYNTLSSLSASWVSDNTTVYSNSARWSGVFSTTRAYSGDWNSAFNTALIVNSISGEWDLAPNVYTNVNAGSANWVSVYNNVRSISADNSAKLNSIFSNVNTNSASWGVDSDVQVRSLTGNWQNTYTITYNNSADWNTAFIKAGTDLDVRSLSGNWQNTYNTTYSTSARWENAFTTINSQSANNRSVYTSVRSQSASWIDTNTTVWTYSGAWNNVIDTLKYDNTYTTVYSNSATWNNTIILRSDLNSLRDKVTLKFDLSGGTVNGNAAFNGDVSVNGDLEAQTIDTLGSITVTKSTPAIASGTLTINFASASLFYVNLNSNITAFTFLNIPASPKVFSFTLQLVGDGTVRTINWPTSFRWGTAGAPTPTSTLNKVDTYTFVTHDGGTNWFALVVNQNQ